MNTYALVIALYHKEGLSEKEISYVLHDDLVKYEDFSGSPLSKVKAILENEKESVSLVAKKYPYHAIKVVDTENSKVYNSIKELSKALNVPYDSLVKYIGTRRFKQFKKL